MRVRPHQRGLRLQWAHSGRTRWRQRRQRGAFGAPGFTSAAQPIFQNLGPVKQLPPNTRMSFRTVSCTTDGAATTMCVNAQDQTGFVLTPSGSFVLSSNPLLERPEGTNPYAN